MLNGHDGKAKSIKYCSQGKRLEDKCSNCNFLRLSTDYRKNCKIVSPDSLAVYTVKFEHRDFSMW